MTVLISKYRTKLFYNETNYFLHIDFESGSKIGKEDQGQIGKPFHSRSHQIRIPNIATALPT